MLTDTLLAEPGTTEPAEARQTPAGHGAAAESMAANSSATRPRTPESTAQAAWSRTAVATRLQVLRCARHELAGLASEITAAVSPQIVRTPADTLVSELLPLLEAIRFLERAAPRLLRTRRLGRRGLPFWLSGVDTEIERVPLGKVLVIGPSNYPLFLPGVQVFQALAAGNAVIWKPGLGGADLARLVAGALSRAGLPQHLLLTTENTVEAAEDALRSGIDKVFFTGSGQTGRALLAQLAPMATPCVLELSGNDACIVLPSADLDRVAAALAFGMRLNGSATCMAPRRILLVDCPPARRDLLIERLRSALAAVPAIALSATARRRLLSLLADAEQAGATILGDTSGETLRPLLLLHGTPEMEIARTDIFAPVLTLIEVSGLAGLLDAQSACPLALTTSIFGEVRAARALAPEIVSGVITINDLIVPTADPRIPFGGRRASGFGVTRGGEGLLEMTAVKVVATRRNRSVQHYEPTGKAHLALFTNTIHAAHAGTLSRRWSGLKRALKAALELRQK